MYIYVFFSPKFPNSHKKEGGGVPNQAYRKLGDWKKLKKKDPSQYTWER